MPQTIAIKAPFKGSRDAELQVFVDGRRIYNVLSVRLDAGPGQMTRVTICAQADVVVDGVVEKVERAEPAPGR
jgi:hypothetical protein